jgi:two-component system nitrogen regulation sensor histidine kinase GlnL
MIDGQRLLDGLHTAVLLFDAQLNLRYWNLAARMMFALSRKHAAGATAQELLQCPHESVELAFQRTQRTLQPFTEREMSLILPDQRMLTVDCVVTPLDDNQAGLPELLVELRQVDNQVRMMREAQSLAQQAATRALLRGLAHEIKNPLSGLRGAAQLLERQLADPTLRDYTQVVIEEADRLKNLVNRMLGPVRIPSKRPISIHQVMERVYTLIRAETAPPVTIVRDYDPSLPALHADMDQLIQALLNIARNAVEALDGRGLITLSTRVVRQLSIGSLRHKLAVRVDVVDDGPGIPDTLIKQIFLPMVSGRPQGSGLGLAISQTIVQQHSGFIECVSQPGETRFTLYLPVEDFDAQSLDH